MGSNNYKVLVVDTVHSCLVEGLTELGYHVDYKPEITKKKIEECIDKYFGIILRSKIHLNEHILSKTTNLKFIGRIGAGKENIDEEYANSKDIQCFNSPEGNRDAVGEHTLGMLLSLLNNLNRADKEVRQGLWKREANRGFEIKGKTVGIIGYGNMGGAFAKCLKGFDAKVIAYDKYKFDYSDEFVTEHNLQTVFEETDFLSLHVPLTSETEYLVNDSFFAKFKKSIYLINTARGQVVNTKHLVKNMRSGKVLGAALDVLEYENFSFENLDLANLPEDFKYLIKSDKVLLTPHIAGWTFESKIKLAKVIVEKIRLAFG